MTNIKQIQSKSDLLDYKRYVLTRLEQEIVEPETFILKEILDLKKLWQNIEDLPKKRVKLLQKVRVFLLSTPILGTVANHRHHSFINLFK